LNPSLKLFLIASGDQTIGYNLKGREEIRNKENTDSKIDDKVGKIEN
jgi:hypothetical protein